MRTMTWIAANGTATVLDGSAGITLLQNPVGLEAPEPVNTTDEYAGFDGGVLVGRRNPSRSIALGLYLEHETRVETVVGELAAMLRGPGQLRWADDVNTRTLRQVIFDGGLNGAGITTPRERAVVVSMIALDPWWYGPAESLAIDAAGTPTAFDAAIVFSSFTPFDGGGSSAIVVPGDAEVYPVFTIVGPFTSLVVGSGGVSWSLAEPLGYGVVLIVDHRPSSRGPRLADGPVDWSLLNEASRLFSFPAGPSAVITGATGTDAPSDIVMAWEPRYLTP